MIPQQPCVDKYGANICHLQRFHLGQSFDVGGVRRPRPETKPSGPEPDGKPPGKPSSGETSPKPPKKPRTPPQDPTKPPPPPKDKRPTKPPDTKPKDKPLQPSVPPPQTIPTSTGSALRPPKLVQFNKSIDELTPDMRARARLIEAGYRMQEAYDITLHNTEENNYAREDGFAAVREVLADNNLSSRYTLDEELSDAQVLVFEDAETGKGVLVFRGANAGHDETESGQESNARDQQSFTRAFTNPKHNEVSLYPTVDEQVNSAIHKYGGVENLESVSYSNGGLLGHYTNREYGIRGIAFYPVVGIRQTGDWLAGRMQAPMQYVRTTTTPIAMGAAQNIATLARLGISPKNVTFTTVAPLQGSDAAMEHGSNTRKTPTPT